MRGFFFESTLLFTPNRQKLVGFLPTPDHIVQMLLEQEKARGSDHEHKISSLFSLSLGF